MSTSAKVFKPGIERGETVDLIREVEGLATEVRRLRAHPALARARFAMVGTPAPPVPPTYAELDAAAATLKRTAACLRHFCTDDELDDLEIPF